MKRSLLLGCCLLITVLVLAKTIVVKNMAELNAANKNAMAGDVIILEDGEWRDAAIVLNCSGTKEQPISFKAKTPGKVILTGHSYLKLGGNYIIVDGLYFTNGYAGDNAVIDFRVDKNQLANNCRVTNCVVDDFNNAKRMDDNDWVSLSGKNNRVDHCSFINKKNMGVLLAVLLDDDRSRENFHSIDHNYFGVRVPLASNGGEIIRVGVSQHCQFNSNTSITDNFFEKCDGEAEVISIKSGENIIRGNLFKECQGAVVLRHGDNNTVENNVFLGNGKTGTGGVRVINRGQWVVNNLFYKCRGEGFRAPLAMMNGVPNSPAHRYVQVTDAVIANNSFVSCAPISLCEGSDKERSMPPDKVIFANNIFYTSFNFLWGTRDSLIYNAYDNLAGIRFAGNKISQDISQQTASGFERSPFDTQSDSSVIIPTVNAFIKISDSLQQVALKRLQHPLETKPGFSDLQLAKAIRDNAVNHCGPNWWVYETSGKKQTNPFANPVNCKTASEVYEQVKKNVAVAISLTGTEYVFDNPIYITSDVVIRGNKQRVSIRSGKMPTVFIVSKGGLTFLDLEIDGTGVQATNFIASDTMGGSDHYKLSVHDCIISGFDRKNGCENFFYAHKSTVADLILIGNCTFTNNRISYIVMNAETDDRGYYNAETVAVLRNTFTNERGQLLNIYRGGSDESTLGPELRVNGNTFNNCSTLSGPFIQLTGVQQSEFFFNNFENCNQGGILLVFKDIVRANHQLMSNTIKKSGKIETNKFVKTHW